MVGGFGVVVAFGAVAAGRRVVLFGMLLDWVEVAVASGALLDGLTMAAGDGDLAADVMEVSRRGRWPSAVVVVLMATVVVCRAVGVLSMAVAVRFVGVAPGVGVIGEDWI